MERKHFIFKSSMDSQFITLNTQFSKMNIQINTILEGDIRELRGRILKIETGADEWTKTIRERTHILANQLHMLQTEMVLLKNGIITDRRISDNDIEQ